VNWEARYVPWIFRNVAQAGRFLQLLFDAQCPPEEAFDEARARLGFRRLTRRLVLNWELSFATIIRE
jgi:hypothetical protein